MIDQARSAKPEMCGIAGFSVDPASTAGRTLATQALLAGIAERGADAAGYAHRSPGSGVSVHKQYTGASALLDAVSLPHATTQSLVHVRDFTKGHPSVLANNHPIRHGAVVGIHNGVVANDEAILARHRIDRAEPGMTVDSEAIFALMHASGSDHRALEEVTGTMAAAWLDERDDTTLYLARGIGRPLWLGRGRGEILFASTRAALEVAERALRLSLRKQELGEGRVLHVHAGEIVSECRFRPDRSYREHVVRPAVRTPHEGRSCLARLATLAA